MLRNLFTGWLFVINSCALVIGQGSIDIKSNILDEVNASNCLKHCADFNLRGKVKESITIDANTSDTLTTHQFNRNGFLRYQGVDNQTSYYQFKEDVLMERKTVLPHYGPDTVTSVYNEKGQLIRQEFKRNDNNELKITTAEFTYKNGWKDIAIKYNYNFDISGWDVVLRDVYTVQFDSLERVQSIVNKSFHKGVVYQYTKTYGYDDTTRNLIMVWHRDKNAGSNSALELLLAIDYSQEDSTTTESLSDYTIRNSAWSHSYQNTIKVNSHGDIIEESLSADQDQFYGAVNSESSVSMKYFYTYDSFGNWIEKFQVSDSTKDLISRRQITYYT